MTRRFRRHPGRGAVHTRTNRAERHKPKDTPSDTPSDTPKWQKIDKIVLREDQAGITEFVSDHKGFTGVFKARYNDFHVNEIDADGNVLYLTDTTVTKLVGPDVGLDSSEIETIKEELSDLVTPSLWAEIEKLAKGERTENVEIDVTDVDKEKRTGVHKAVRRLHGSKCNSVTSTKDDDKKFILVKRHDNRSRNENQRTAGTTYCHFLIYKENMDTSEVASIISNGLRLKPSQVNYCGTKDKRGHTTQKFCIKNRNPQQIAGTVKHIRNIKIGNFTLHKDTLKLGDLKGNRFRIALRHITADRDEIENALNSVKERGFINYYGLQRFGNCASIPTYEIGIAILKCDYKKAVELILKPRENDIPFIRNIREIWWKDRDSTAAASMFYSDKFIEKRVLEGLSKYGENNYLHALQNISRNVVLLYTHAYQSLVFNQVASKRIKEIGLKLIVGDLVYRDLSLPDGATLDIADECPDDQNTESKEEEIDAEISVFKQKVKPLTEEDIASGKYTIFDVVLPLPGYDITYPPNIVGQWYEEIMSQAKLTSADFKHAVKMFTLGGAYRKLLLQPKNMSWYFRKYNTPEEDVIPSHIEESTDDKTEGEGKFTALVLDFCLPASAYATMLIREILRLDTSATNQAQIGREEMRKFEEQAGTSSSTEPEESSGAGECLKSDSSIASQTQDEGKEVERHDEADSISSHTENEETTTANDERAKKRHVDDNEESDIKRVKSSEEA